MKSLENSLENVYLVLSPLIFNFFISFKSFIPRPFSYRKYFKFSIEHRKISSRAISIPSYSFTSNLYILSIYVQRINSSSYSKHSVFYRILVISNMAYKKKKKKKKQSPSNNIQARMKLFARVTRLKRNVES